MVILIQMYLTLYMHKTCTVVSNLGFVLNLLISEVFNSSERKCTSILAEMSWTIALVISFSFTCENSFLVRAQCSGWYTHQQVDLLIVVGIKHVTLALLWSRPFWIVAVFSKSEIYIILNSLSFTEEKMVCALVASWNLYQEIFDHKEPSYRK